MKSIERRKSKSKSVSKSKPKQRDAWTQKFGYLPHKKATFDPAPDSDFDPDGIKSVKGTANRRP
jgi:hypothetical protein